jgi:uncharacterized repeat protein (TIGR03803 family)
MNQLKTIRALLTLALSITLAAGALGQQLETLYGFAQPPANPSGGVVQGPDGDFYGTTARGGSFGFGSIFRITTNGVLTVLVDFNTANGAYPYSGLTSDTNGNFYGTTQNGGGPGYGTVFRVTTNGVLTTLTNFYPPVGSNPAGALIWGNDGTLYGTTVNGGASSNGTVFQITTNGVLNSFFSFSGSNGAHPNAGLLLARDGNFYGTTEYGGIGLGVVFQLTPGGVLTDLGSFDYINNGAFPISALVEDAAGNFYGTATMGGGGGAGAGTLFEIPATNNQTIVGLATFSSNPYSGMSAGPSNVFYGTTLSSIYRFTPTNTTVTTLFSFDGTDGSDAYATPVLDTKGDLYGTTYYGGSNGFGTVYELAANDNFTQLYGFSASPGSQPMGALARDANGTLYGANYTGGPTDAGTVFSLTTNGTFRTLLPFNGSSEGANPMGGVLLGSNGFLYGTCFIDNVFEVNTNGQDFDNLATFGATNGAYPYAGLVSDAGGNFYGTTHSGGTYNYGTVFKLDTNLVLTTLATFDFTNGAWPVCTLVLDNGGNLWGTTIGGGGGIGAGTVFKVSTNGLPTNTLLVPFASFDGSDGSIPEAGVVLGADGAYYGTTEAGGAFNYGAVFRVTTNGVITPVVSFAGGNGAYPLTSLLPGSNGVFYGTTSGSFDNQTNGDGTVFRVTTNGVLTTYLEFNGTNGSAPASPLLQGSDGALYGTTQFGGPEGSGTIFKLFLGPIFPTSLNIQSVSNVSVVTWTNPVFNLQASPALNGPFTNVENSFSPYTNTFTNQAMFFRLVAEP